MERKKILVIEDDFDFNGFMVKYLTRNGYSVKNVYSCEEAMNALLYNELPDIVIADIELWDGNCLPILELLEEPDYEHITVILSTGYAFAPRNYNINMARIKQFLLKPVDPRSLSLLVKSFAPLATDADVEFEEATRPVHVLPHPL